MVARDGWLPALMVWALARGYVSAPPHRPLRLGYYPEPNDFDVACGFFVQGEAPLSWWALGTLRAANDLVREGSGGMMATWRSALSQGRIGPTLLAWEECEAKSR